MPSAIKAAENSRAETLLLVSRGMVRGESPGEMAAYMKLPRADIEMMQDEILNLWRTQTMDNALLLRRREVERLMEVLRESFKSWEKSKQPEVVTTEFRKRLDRDQEEDPGPGRRRRKVSDKNADEHEYAVTGIKTQYRQRDEGNPAFLALVKDTSASIRSLLGLDEPTKSLQMSAVVGEYAPDVQKRLMADPAIRKVLMDLEEMKSKIVGEAKALPVEVANGGDRNSGGSETPTASGGQ